MTERLLTALFADVELCGGVNLPGGQVVHETHQRVRAGVDVGREIGRRAWLNADSDDLLVERGQRGKRPVLGELRSCLRELRLEVVDGLAGGESSEGEGSEM